MVDDQADRTVTVERDGHVLLIGLNRPTKRNSFNRAMLSELAQAYGLLESDDDLWCGVLFAHGDHFTSGLDLADVAGDLMSGNTALPDGARDPWRLDGTWTTPIVAAVHGWVMTLGIELALAADITVGAADSRFAQIENRRGIYPFGGASFRFPRTAGWGNAMRWILTGDEFDAAEAYRIGLIQQVTPDAASARAEATAIAHTIADRCAPLGVRATLRSAHTALEEGQQAAIDRLRPDVVRLFGSADGAEGVASFVERRDAVFAGR
ncbi:crotonase/enoyl-CoA hydratase family protein [Millisia brevis]|uniref:crotonase/enoyl-CoA hydratase family protein n=1 Tax=Millisia brevis TaxID=264148 RepID=UPI00082DC767|nr:crotonase/enoyl-CoA hydratase family protein [Millisia brevis]